MGLTPLLVPDSVNGRESRQIREITIIVAVALAILFAITAFHLLRSGLRFKRSFVENASTGFEKIEQGTLALRQTDFTAARQLFRKANQTFQRMENDAWFTSPKLSIAAKKNTGDPLFESGRAVIQAGLSLSEAGSLFVTTAEHLEVLPKLFFTAQAERQETIGASLTEKLNSQIPTIQKASRKLKEARNAMQGIPEHFIPPLLNSRFTFAKVALDTLVAFFQDLEKDMPAILALLGDIEPHTFLILLQNNSELRPSGGFIGNYLITETNDGYITKNEVFDVYQADHILDEVLDPPEELLAINSRWFLRDSNYSAHFPISAKRASWFLEHSGGPGVDTVIAIDQSFITRILDLIGPISLNELEKPLASESFETIISYIIESKLTGRQDPKAILKRLIPEFEQATLRRAEPAALLQLLNSATQEKHILAYSKDPVVQDFFRRHGLSGEMKSIGPKEDYLTIAHTSVSGNKSDRYIKETITHDTYIKSDDSVISEVTITRSHLWNTETEKQTKALISSFEFQAPDKKIINILGKGANIMKLRIYVPSGSTLEKSSNTSVETKQDIETGKTYFSATMHISAGETQSLTLRYRLPFTLDLDPVDTYRLTSQKQAGEDNVVFRKRIFTDSGVLNYKSFPEEGSFDADGVWNFETDFNRDLFFTSVFGN